MDVKAVIETTLKAEIIKALNAAPEAIDQAGGREYPTIVEDHEDDRR